VLIFIHVAGQITGSVAGNPTLQHLGLKKAAFVVLSFELDCHVRGGTIRFFEQIATFLSDAPSRKNHPIHCNLRSAWLSQWFLDHVLAEDVVCRFAETARNATQLDFRTGLDRALCVDRSFFFARLAQSETRPREKAGTDTFRHSTGSKSRVDADLLWCAADIGRPSDHRLDGCDDLSDNARLQETGSHDLLAAVAIFTVGVLRDLPDGGEFCAESII